MMNVYFTKRIQTGIIKKLQCPYKTNTKQANEYVYSFITSLSCNEVDWQQAEDMLLMCLYEGFKLPETNTKDVEISADTELGLYTVKFVTSKILGGTIYATEIAQIDGEWFSELLDMPMQNIAQV